MSGTPGETGSSNRFKAVTKHDSNDQAIAGCRALYVGSAGDVAVVPEDGGDPVVFPGVPAGTMLSIRISRVRATDTTASGFVALF